MKSNRCFSLGAVVFLILNFILSEQALSDNIDVKLPDNDNTSSFQVIDSDDNVLMKVQSGGHVGLGTTSPNEILHLKGASAGCIIERDDVNQNPAELSLWRNRGENSSVLPNDAIGAVNFKGSDGVTVIPRVAASIRVVVDGQVGQADMPGRIEIRTTPDGLDAAVTRMTIKNNGNVGIGTNSPLYPLEMGSGAYVTNGGVWTNASSREFKEDISALTAAEALEALKKLTPTKFRYKVDNEKKHLGFIAEDVPELVASKDRKGLSSMDIVAVLTKVVQKQQKEIEELKAKLVEKK